MKRWGHTLLATIAYLGFVQAFHANLLNSSLLMLYMMVAVAGGIFPDVDLLLMRKLKFVRHRNAFTHSAATPIAILTLAITLPFPHALLEGIKHVARAFALGVTTHLIGDMKRGGVVGLRGGSRRWLLANSVLSFPPLVETVSSLAF